MILWTMFIETREVDTHAKDVSVFLRDQDWVSDPCGLRVQLLDEVCLSKSINFRQHGFAGWFRKMPQRLFNWPSHWIHIKRVLGKFPGYSWHVSWTPCEDFPALTEELDERAFLCAIHICCDSCRLLGICRVNLYFLRVLGGIKAWLLQWPPSVRQHIIISC